MRAWLDPRLMALGCGALLSAPAYALHPLITEDTGTQGKGVAQVELAVSLERDREGDTLTRRSDPTLVLTYGLNDTVDLFASLPYLSIRTDNAGSVEKVRGASDPSLGFKWRFFERDQTSLAIKPSILITQGDAARGLGKGRSGYTLPLVLTRTWDGLAFHMHGAYARNRNVSGEREHLWHASIAGEYHPNERMKWVLDLGADRQTDPAKRTHPAYVLGGLVYSLGQLDLSVGLKGKLNSAAPDQAWLFGLTWRTQ